jgi:hypothetical protein
VGDGPHLPEALHAEIVGEPARRLDLGDDGFRPGERLLGGDGEAAERYLEAVPDELADLRRPVDAERFEDLHVPDVEGAHPLQGRGNADVLSGDGALVLRSREEDGVARHAEAVRDFAHEAVRLPVAGADEGDRVLPLARGRGEREGNLGDDEVLRHHPETAARAGRGREPALHTERGLEGIRRREGRDRAPVGPELPGCGHRHLGAARMI